MNECQCITAVGGERSYVNLPPFESKNMWSKGHKSWNVYFFTFDWMPVHCSRWWEVLRQPPPFESKSMRSKGHKSEKCVIFLLLNECQSRRHCFNLLIWEKYCGKPLWAMRALCAMWKCDVKISLEMFSVYCSAIYWTSQEMFSAHNILDFRALGSSVYLCSVYPYKCTFCYNILEFRALGSSVYLFSVYLYKCTFCCNILKFRALGSLQTLQAATSLGCGGSDRVSFTFLHFLPELSLKKICLDICLHFLPELFFKFFHIFIAWTFAYIFLPDLFLQKFSYFYGLDICVICCSLMLCSAF